MKKLILALLVAFLVSMGGVSEAQPPTFPLIVNGSTSLTMQYNAGVLSVRFHRTRLGAISSDHFRVNVPPGAESWLDRPVNAKEPLEIRQTMSTDQAVEAMKRLRQNGGFWQFECYNTQQGYFMATRSKQTFASQRID